jgi:hypothetical protein
MLKPLTGVFWKALYLLFCLLQVKTRLKLPDLRSRRDLLIRNDPETMQGAC